MDEHVIIDFNEDFEFPKPEEVNEELAPKLEKQGYISESDIMHVVYEKLGIRNYTTGWRWP